MVSADLRRRAGRSLAAIAIVALVARPAGAALCTVPSPSHPTADSAARDLACSTIQLAAGTFAENVAVLRDVAIEGAGAGATVVAGGFEVAGSSTDASVARLTIDGTAPGVAGCWASLLIATGGARITADDDVAVANSGLANGPCRLFVDGFESAGPFAWSARFP